MNQEVKDDDVVDEMSRGVRARGWGAAPQTRANPLFFGQKLNFSGRNQQSKVKKILFYRKKRNSFCLAR